MIFELPDGTLAQFDHQQNDKISDLLASIGYQFKLEVQNLVATYQNKQLDENQYIQNLMDSQVTTIMITYKVVDQQNSKPNKPINEPKPILVPKVIPTDSTPKVLDTDQDIQEELERRHIQNLKQDLLNKNQKILDIKQSLQAEKNNSQRLEAENTQLKRDINQLKTKMKNELNISENHQIELKKVQSESEFLRQQLEKLQQTKPKAKQFEIRCAELQEINKNLQTQLDKKESKILKMREKKKALQIQINSIQVQNQTLHQSMPQQPQIGFQMLDMTVQNLNQQLSRVQTQSDRDRQDYKKKIRELEEDMEEINRNLEIQKRAKTDAYFEKSELKKTIYEQEKEIKDMKSKLQELGNQIIMKDQQIMEEQSKLKSIQISVEDKFMLQSAELAFYVQKTHDLESLVDQFKIAMEEQKNNFRQNSTQIFLDLEKKRNLMEREYKDHERQKQQFEQDIKRRQEEQRQESEREKQEYLKAQERLGQNRLQRMQRFSQSSVETHGVIDVCFLVDSTGSMSPYKEKAVECVEQSMRLIKKFTNRNTRWGFVCYKDREYLPNIGGQYEQQDFIDDQVVFMRNLRQIECNGSWKDLAEDVKGGISQMHKLNWTSRFKICIIICDQPAHGRKYYAPSYRSDCYPDDDMDDEIIKMCQKNIVTVCINFQKETEVMFQQMKKIYKDQQKEEEILIQNMINLETSSQTNEQLAKLLADASQRSTATNQSGTKSKNNLAIGSTLGAMEALYTKLKDPINFDQDPSIMTVKANFTVYRTELIQTEDYLELLKDIKRITPAKNMRVSKEGSWQCIRTRDIFAKGQMKAVFLMKRVESGQPQLYVNKSFILSGETYKSMEEVQQECISHLISQRLLVMFRNQYSQFNPVKKAPSIQYSDFLILQDGPNSFWLAERFFPGTFVKYNNNFGFINDDEGPTNQFLQAFSYYTLYISECGLIVNDVQGIGDFLTDPAINTIKGGFDPTDMGEEGQKQFMVNFLGKKLGFEILKSMNIAIQDLK